MRFLLAFALLPFVVACSNDNKAASCQNPGGPVSGATDTHCGTKVTMIDQAQCLPPDAGPTSDAGAGGGTGGDEFPPTMYNVEGDDDDCKYRVKWTSTSICLNSDVNFTITVTRKTDNAPVAGAAPSAEVFLNETHPAPNTNQSPTETSPGVYKIGPIKFDASGEWTVRFHYFESCTDTEESPHGHAAFFVNVP